MGEFLVTIDTKGQVRHLAVPNMLHDEGKEYLLRRCFPPHTDLSGYEIGLSGLATAAPNGHPVSTLQQSTPEAQVAYDNEGGGNSAAHRNLIGYSRQSCTLSVTTAGGYPLLIASEVSFHHVLNWTPGPASDWKDRGLTPPDPLWLTTTSENRLRWAPQVYRHGYPWDVPRWCCDDGGGTWQELLTHDYRYSVAFPVDAVFLATTTSPKRLLFSGRLEAPVSLTPESVLYVSYRGLLTQ